MPERRAQFAEAVRPGPRLLPDDATQQLAALLERLSQVVRMLCMLTAEKYRRAQALNKRARPHIEQHIAWLEQAQADLNQELDQLLQTSPLGHEREQWLVSILGVR